MQGLSNYHSIQSKPPTVITINPEDVPEAQENELASFLPAKSVSTLIAAIMPASVFISLFIISESNLYSLYDWLLISTVVTSIALLSLSSLHNDISWNMAYSTQAAQEVTQNLPVGRA